MISPAVIKRVEASALIILFSVDMKAGSPFDKVTARIAHLMIHFRVEYIDETDDSFSIKIGCEKFHK